MTTAAPQPAVGAAEPTPRLGLQIPGYLYGAALVLGLLLEAVRLLTGSAEFVSSIDAVIILAPMAFLFMLRFPAAAVPFFMFDTAYKTIPLFGHLPFNPTILTGGLTAAVLAFTLARRRQLSLDWATVGFYVFFVVAVFVGFVHTIAPQVAKAKLMYSVTFTALAFVAPVVVIRSRRDIHHFIVGLTLVSIFVSLILLYVFQFSPDSAQAGWQRLGAYGSTHVNIIRPMGVAAVCVIFYWLPRLESTKVKLALIGLLGLFCTFLLSTGTRAGVLFLTITIVLGFILQFRANRAGLRRVVGNVLTLAAVALVIGGFLVAFWDLMGGAVGRATSVFDPNQISQDIQFEDSLQQRSENYTLSWDMTRERPLLGHGLGSFSVRLDQVDSFEYRFPHNIFLELSSELGLPVAVAFMIFLIYLFLPLIKAGWKVPDGEGGGEVRTVFLVTVFLLLTLMTSSTLYRQRDFWCLLSLCGVYVLISQLRRPWTRRATS